jgi:hypothetical protein
VEALGFSLPSLISLVWVIGLFRDCWLVSPMWVVGWVRRLDGCREWVGFITAVWGGIWVGFADVVPRPKAVWVMLDTSLQWVEV